MDRAWRNSKGCAYNTGEIRSVAAKIFEKNMPICETRGVQGSRIDKKKHAHMATVANNDLTRGLRGRIGKWFVFRMVRGKTIVSHAPRKPDPLKQSRAQLQTRNTFREAAAWAVRILLDPAKKQYYADLAAAQALPNAYTAAVREYMCGVAAKRTDEQVVRSIQANQEKDEQQHVSLVSSRPQRTPAPAMIESAKQRISHRPNGIRFNKKDTVIIEGDDVWRMHQSLIHLCNKDPALN